MRQYRKVCLETEGVVLTMWSSRVHKLDEVEGGGVGVSVTPLHTKVDFGDNKGGSDLALVSCVTDTSDDAVGMSVEYIDNTKNMAAKNILQTLPLDEVGVPPKWKRRVKTGYVHAVSQTRGNNSARNKNNSTAGDKRNRDENCDPNVHFSIDNKKQKFVVDGYEEGIVLEAEVVGTQPRRMQ